MTPDPPPSGPAGAGSSADRFLLARVRPTGWRNPAPADRYDLVVVGAGTGGLVSAAIGAAVGARVALVERDRMGGDCLNTGCVPSKGLLAAAHAWHAARTSAERFGGPAAEGPGDFAEAAGRMRRIRAGIADADSADRFREMGVDVFFGAARFASEREVEVEGDVLRFHRAVIATGSRPAVPPVPGLADAGFLTSETVFELEAVPPRLLVLGAGAVGCELAQAFARFGSRVVLLEREQRPLPEEDPEAAERVRASLERDGVRFLGGVEVEGVERDGDATRVRFRRRAAARGGSAGGGAGGGAGGPDEVVGEALLVAVGRKPTVDLGLEAAGVAHGPRGVEVDDRLRTTNRRVYAVGDVVPGGGSTHAADAHARLAVRNALFFGRGRVSDLVAPRVVYTAPELARVGPSAVEAEASDAAHDTVTVELADVDRARLEGEDGGFVRLHLEAGGDTIVGATVVAARAGDLIAQVAQAMTHGIRLGELGDVVFPYPTTAEALRKAADRRRRERLTPRSRKALDLFLRVRRRLP